MRRLALAACALLLAGCGQAAVDTGSTLPGADRAGTTTREAQPPPVPPSEAQVTPELSPHGKDVLARAKRDGAKAVVLIIATEPGATDRAVASLQRLGATVEASDAGIGYVRASVPVDQAEAAASADGVRQVDVDEPLSNIDPTP